MYVLRIIILLLLISPVYGVDEPDNNTDLTDTLPPEATEPSTETLDDTTSVASDESAATAPQLDEASVLPQEQEQPQEPEQPRAIPAPSHRRMLETVKYLRLFNRENEVIKFSDNEASISGLYLPENTGQPQGGILILHDISQHAQWPYSVAPLREYLPDYGWNTLSLFFDNYIEQPLPDITPKTDKTDDSESMPSASNEDDSQQVIADTALPAEDTLDTETSAIDDENFDNNNNTDALDEMADNFNGLPPFDAAENTNSDEATEPPADMAFLKSMTERVEGGLRQLNTLGQFNIVIIAHGLSANWAVETLRARFAVSPNVIGYSLVLIDAKPSSYPDYPLNDELAKLKIPILDLYTKSSEDMSRELQSRKNAVTRQQPLNYMQIGLPALKTIYTNKQNMISRRVRGWLKTHAEGEVVTMKDSSG